MTPLQHINPKRFETAPILKTLARASRALAELKGVAKSIPNQNILIQTLNLQEAKDSSEIENIVTTHDELFKEILSPSSHGAAKEVNNYRSALQKGFLAVKANGLLTLNTILDIQSELERNRAGLRKLPGTALKNGAGEVVYTPPQHPTAIEQFMGELEQFMNNDTLFDADPLVKMTLIHHQFESIHPFYDGNGRTGRIINVLYLVQKGLLDIPILYLSRQILRTKADYYRLLQSVRDDDAWEDWVLYVLGCVEESATESIRMVQAIGEAMKAVKTQLRQQRFYSQDLLNSLFMRPYTRIEIIEHELNISRPTASKYLNILVEAKVLALLQVGRNRYFVNTILLNILSTQGQFNAHGGK